MEKEITVKLNKIVNWSIILRQMIDDENIDTVLKFKLLTLLKKFEQPMVNFETIRNDKIRLFGKQNEHGDYYIDPEDKESVEKIESSLSELLNLDIKCDFDKLKSYEIFNQKGVTTNYLIGLYDLIEE